MNATLACPVCAASNIAFGAAACPNCGVGFSTPVVAPTMHQPAPQPAVEAIPYASIWRRMGAAIIDSIILMVPFAVIFGISFLRAAGRDVLTYLSAIILLIGYLMIAFTEKRQALHDKLTDTVVLHDR